MQAGVPDYDTSPNANEYNVGTWPNVADTDRDSVTDLADPAPLDPIP